MKPSGCLKHPGLGGNRPSGVLYTHCLLNSTTEATSVFVRARHRKRTQSVPSPSVSEVTFPPPRCKTVMIQIGEQPGWLNLLANKQTATCAEPGVCARVCSEVASSLPLHAAFSSADSPSAASLLFPCLRVSTWKNEMK